MGLDVNTYAFDKKKFNKDFYYAGIFNDYEYSFFDDNLLCSWRKWFSLCDMMIRHLSAGKDTGNTKASVYDYYWRMRKKDVKFLKKQVMDIDSEVYANTIWDTISKKDRRKWRKLFLKDIKDMKKALNKGKYLYFEASY